MQTELIQILVHWSRQHYQTVVFLLILSKEPPTPRPSHTNRTFSPESALLVPCAPHEGVGAQVPHLHTAFKLERTNPQLCRSTALRGRQQGTEESILKTPIIPCPGSGRAGYNNRALSVPTAAGGILPPPRHCRNFLWHLDRVWKDLSVVQGVCNLKSERVKGIAGNHPRQTADLWATHLC